MRGERGHFGEDVEVVFHDDGVDVDERALLSRFAAKTGEILDAFDAFRVGAFLRADHVVDIFGAVDGDADEIETFASEAFGSEADAELGFVFFEHDGVGHGPAARAIGATG